jgi:hypothetical protein
VFAKHPYQRLLHLRALVSEGESGRQVGLALLVQFTPQLTLSLPGQAQPLGVPQQWLAEGGVEVGEREPLWVLLRDCLVRLLLAMPVGAPADAAAGSLLCAMRQVC